MALSPIRVGISPSDKNRTYVIAPGMGELVTAYLWGGGGGSGGSKGAKLGGNGSPGQLYKVTVPVQVGDILEISIGLAGAGGQNESGGVTAGTIQNAESKAANYVYATGEAMVNAGDGSSGGAGGSGFSEGGISYAGGSGGNGISSGSGGGGGGATVLKLTRPGIPPTTKTAAPATGNLFQYDPVAGLTAWIEGIDWTAAEVDTNERASLKASIVYGPLASYMTEFGIAEIQEIIELWLDGVIDVLNNDISFYSSSSVYVVDGGDRAFGTGTSFTATGITYDRGVSRGSATFNIILDTAARNEYVNDLKTELGTEYTSAASEVQIILDNIIEFVVDDIIITQFSQMTSTVDIYNYSISSSAVTNILAVAAGGAGGGGSATNGNGTSAQTNSGTGVANTTGQNGETKTDSAGGGGGGGGGGRFGGLGGSIFSTDNGGLAGQTGTSWRHPSLTLSGELTLGSLFKSAVKDGYGVGDFAKGGVAGGYSGTGGYALIMFDTKPYPYIKVPSVGWKPVEYAYVKVNDIWKTINAMYVHKEGKWQTVSSSPIRTVAFTELASGVNRAAGGTRSY
jgi:hypothetical protein